MHALRRARLDDRASADSSSRRGRRSSSAEQRRGAVRVAVEPGDHRTVEGDQLGALHELREQESEIAVADEDLADAGAATPGSNSGSKRPLP